MSDKFKIFAQLCLVLALVIANPAIISQASADANKQGKRDQNASSTSIVDSRAKQNACASSPHHLVIFVEGVQSRQGVITADLHDDNPDNFLKKGEKLDRARVAVTGNPVKICLMTPKPGLYSVGLYHDENANKKFDKNFLGIPIEPFGVSNNPPMNFGPPSVEDAIVQVGQKGKSITIYLKRYVGKNNPSTHTAGRK